jgi:uncharacterized protein YjiS (DUF1127 family)
MRDAAFFIASQQEGTPAGLLQTVLGWFRQAYKSWKNRKAVATLADFDDHMLADLGLTRGDVRDALNLPFASDPGRELQFRASRNIRHGWNA